MRSLVIVLAISLSLGGCGPSHRGDDGGGGGSGSGVGVCTSNCSTVTGRVWAPRWALGDVPPGQEIPIFGALVYVLDHRPEPIPDHVYCESCVSVPQTAVSSGHDGAFTMNVAQGHYWLVIEKGQFRIEQEIDVPAGALALPAPATTLPHEMDPTHGAWIPKVAIVRGNYDAVEDILGKIGFGQLGGNNKLADPMGAADHYADITFYDWGGSGSTNAVYLLQHVDEMRKYHIIFFPCSTAVDDAVLSDQATLANLRKFVHDGGKLYVTDWSGETADRAFPPQLKLGDGGFGGGGIDSVGDYDAAALTGTLTTPGTADGSLYTASDAKVTDPDLHAWLGLQIGPDQVNPTPHMYTPDSFTVEDNWNWIDSLHAHVKGTDGMGQPVYDDPKAWLVGSDGSHGPRPLAVTYEPTGCGKVLYSTFQTSGASAAESHVGLMPQERVLLFLIMEITACTDNPVLQ